MKPHRKKKMDSKEWFRNLMKKVNYGKFLRKTVFESRKQRNIHKK